MIKQIILLFAMLCAMALVEGQTVVSKDSTNNSGRVVTTSIVDGDTILQVDLKPITIMPPMVLTTKKQFKQYSRLVLYVRKVYPYSQIVRKQMDTINTNLSKYKTEKEKKRYIDQKEKELKQEFEGQLRNLTFSQGKILIKLVNRETGQTTYEIVKQLKGSLNAYFWQSIARLFGSNLKLEYDATGEDIMIEDIVIRIENGEL